MDENKLSKAILDVADDVSGAFGKIRLELDDKQNVIDSMHRLDYSLLRNQPEKLSQFENDEEYGKQQDLVQLVYPLADMLASSQLDNSQSSGVVYPEYDDLADTLTYEYPTLPLEKRDSQFQSNLKEWLIKSQLWHFSQKYDGQGYSGQGTHLEKNMRRHVENTAANGQDAGICFADRNIPYFRKIPFTCAGEFLGRDYRITNQDTSDDKMKMTVSLSGLKQEGVVRPVIFNFNQKGRFCQAVNEVVGVNLQWKKLHEYSWDGTLLDHCAIGDTFQVLNPQFSPLEATPDNQPGRLVARLIDYGTDNVRGGDGQQYKAVFQIQRIAECVRYKQTPGLTINQNNIRVPFTAKDSRENSDFTYMTRWDLSLIRHWLNNDNFVFYMFAEQLRLNYKEYASLSDIFSNSLAEYLNNNNSISWMYNKLGDLVPSNIYDYDYVESFISGIGKEKYIKGFYTHLDPLLKSLMLPIDRSFKPLVCDDDGAGGFTNYRLSQQEVYCKDRLFLPFAKQIFGIINQTVEISDDNEGLRQFQWYADQAYREQREAVLKRNGEFWLADAYDKNTMHVMLVNNNGPLTLTYTWIQNSNNMQQIGIMPCFCL